MFNRFLAYIGRATAPKLKQAVQHRPILSIQRTFSSATPLRFDEFLLPRIPPQIDLRHLSFQPNQQGNLMLLAEDQIASIRQVLQGAPNGKYSKNYHLSELNIQSKYSIIKTDEKLYAVYPDSCGKGIAGKVKLAQDLDTGKWVAVKIQSVTPVFNAKVVKDRTEVELQALNKLTASLGFFEYDSPSKGFQTYLLFKYAYGRAIPHLLNHYKRYQYPLSMQMALHISEQIIEALERMQVQYDVSHNDLHTGENVIYDYNKTTVKLIDFGFSSFYSESLHPDVLMRANLSNAGKLIARIFESVSEEALANDQALYDVQQSVISYANMLQRLTIRGSDQAQPSEVKAFFQNARALLGDRPLDIGKCDIAALSRGDRDERMQYIARLKSHDLVYLYQDEKPWPLYGYLGLTRDLQEKHGLFIAGRVNWRQAGCLFAGKETGQQTVMGEILAEEKIGFRPEA